MLSSKRQFNANQPNANVLHSPRPYVFAPNANILHRTLVHSRFPNKRRSTPTFSFHQTPTAFLGFTPDVNNPYYRPSKTPTFSTIHHPTFSELLHSSHNTKNLCCSPSDTNVLHRTSTDAEILQQTPTFRYISPSIANILQYSTSNTDIF